MRVLLSICAALTVALPATVTAADPGAASALQHFDRGQQLYAAGRHDDASLEFKRAFEIDPVPKYLYNAAQASRLAGNCRGAVPLYKAFLRIAPDADSRAATRNNIDRCRDQQAKAPGASKPQAAATALPLPSAATTPPLAAPATPPLAAPAAPPPMLRPPAIETAFAFPTLTAASVSSASRPGDEPRRARLKWIGALGGATAGAALVAAASLAGLGASRFDELTRSCAPNCSAIQVQPLQRDIDASTGLFITGALIASATLVALVLTHYRGVRWW